MSKNKKKKKRRGIPLPDPAAYNPAYPGAKAAVKASLRTFNWRLALLMLAVFAVLCTVYFVLLRFYVFWASPVLYTAAAVLFLTFFFVNRGFSREVVSREMLPTDWSEERKERYIAEDAARKTFARNIMIIAVPVFGVVMADMVILFILPVLS